MIEYVEIRNKQLEIVGIVDTFNSIIWHPNYYGAGDFEIYAPCSPLNLALLVAGNIITRPDDQNVGIIERLQFTFSVQNGRMIIATGRFAKSLLDRRIIYRITDEFQVSVDVVSGNVETAVRNIIRQNAISCSFDHNRDMSNLVLGAHSGSTAVITDENGNTTGQQVIFENLLTWTDSILQRYKLGASVRINSNSKFEYFCYSGVNRAVDNTDGNDPVIFSQEFENLVSNEFEYNESNYKNAAVVSGDGEGLNRFCSVVIPTQTGADRRELYVDRSKTARVYIAPWGAEIPLTSEDYNLMLSTIGAQELAKLPILRTFAGEINLNSLTFKYKTNYNLGDIITVQDSETNIFVNTRIVEIIEVQDEKGYSISGKYES